MSLHHAQPGEQIDIRPLGAALRETVSHTLVRSDQIEVLRLVLIAGKTLPLHEIRASAITLQCLEGEAILDAYGVSQILTVGSLVFLPACTPHRISGITDTSLLVTLLLSRNDS